MDALLRGDIEHEIEMQHRLVLASEGWGKSFLKDQKSHAEIIKCEARLLRKLRKLFSETSKNIDRSISWSAYEQNLSSHIQADIHVDVIVNDDQLDQDVSKEFVTFTFADITEAITIGAQAGEAIYSKNLGIVSTDAIIQKLATDRVAWLVGKKMDKYGALVDNPSSKYSITDKMREDINQTIKTGINLGQDRATVTKNLQKVIANPKRAEVIAQTETVNAYSEGHLEFAHQSGATGKEWQDVFAVDICKTYADEGVVPLNYQYGGKQNGPAAHPGCRCSLRLAYENEYPKS